ncbi:ADP-ribosylation factor-like protein 11 [Pangasianodon hypophthalmus]|uniref:ADP-ribosylation factor-like protein 11 n=1 Tax=Pangasianodon hypophthalmus TaxID=310915 RepID=UPI000F00132C|nr:ADP-ribosylation factor-like protein 11 [Pangasianodon hypophthalmus]
MGPNLQKQAKKFKKVPQVALMGLDSAGKSTLLYRLQRGVIMETSPTIGFNVVTLELNKKSVLTVWDIGGQKSLRPNWRHYLDGCKALVFVVDASDRTRMEEAKMALKTILSDHNLENVPLMVLANKTDIPNSMTLNEVCQQLDLESCTDRIWEIQACSGLRGRGLQQAFLSVAKLIQKK